MTAWHLDSELTDRYVGGALDLALAASVESHVLHCGQCRQALSAAVSEDRLDRVWDAITVGIDSPRSRPVQRLLTRLGTLLTTPSRRVAWVAGVALAFGFALIPVGLGHPHGSPSPPPVGASPTNMLVHRPPTAPPPPAQVQANTWRRSTYFAI